MQLGRIFVLLPFVAVALAVPIDSKTGISKRVFTYEADMSLTTPPVATDNLVDDVEANYGPYAREELTELSKRVFTYEADMPLRAATGELIDDVKASYGPYGR